MGLWNSISGDGALEWPKSQLFIYSLPNRNTGQKYKEYIQALARRSPSDREGEAGSCAQLCPCDLEERGIHRLRGQALVFSAHDHVFICHLSSGEGLREASTVIVWSCDESKMPFMGSWRSSWFELSLQ